jgi:hypothetical protein
MQVADQDQAESIERSLELNMIEQRHSLINNIGQTFSLDIISLGTSEVARWLARRTGLRERDEGKGLRWDKGGMDDDTAETASGRAFCDWS